MFKKLAKQLKSQNDETAHYLVSSPIECANIEDKNFDLKKLSKHALDLYERKTDINNFSKLVLSEPENKSHEKIVDKLFSEHKIIDPFEENILFELSENEKFLDDLGL